MEKPKFFEDIKEYSLIAFDAARLCVADALNWIDEKIDDAMDCWGGDE